MPDWAIWIILIICAYILGAVPVSYLVARARGIDLTKQGTKQVGGGNLWRTTSRKFGLSVGIFDFIKGMIMVSIAYSLDLNIAQQVVVGLAAVVGHNWPVFLRFSGGRGILTALGVVFILVPWLTPVVLIIAFGLAPIRQLALGVFLAILSLPIASWFFSQPLNIKEPLPVTLGFLAVLLILIFRRLSVPRADIAASVSYKQLFLNRLLFDRDIRDRKAWISQTRDELHSVEQSPQPEKEGGEVLPR